MKNNIDGPKEAQYGPRGVKYCLQTR